MINKILSILICSLILFSFVTFVIAKDKQCLNSTECIKKIMVQKKLGPQLSFYPKSHNFGDKYEGEIASTTFTVWNSGCCQLTFSFSEMCNWVDISPSSGYSYGDYITITVTIDTFGLNVGSYHCDIDISSNGGEGTFEVDVNVIKASTPVLFVNPSILDFGDVLKGATAQTCFEIWNCGEDVLDYTLSENCEWFEINPNSGSSTGEHDIINVYINTSELDYRSYGNYIHINSNGGNEVLTVLVNVVESTHPLLAFDPLYYDFGDILKGNTAKTFFKIWNAGSGQLHFNIIENYDWVTITPLEGYSEGEPVTITVDVNTTNLSFNNYNVDIHISSNGGDNIFNINLNVKDAINNPPTNPVLYGPKSGRQGQAYSYTCFSNDLDYDSIFYNFSWGDGSCTGWLGPFNSGEACDSSHIWNEKGVFEIKVIAIDSNNAESDWSKPKKVGIDCYFNISVNEAWMLLQNTSNGIQIPIDIRTFKDFINERIDTPSSFEQPKWFGEKLFNQILTRSIYMIFYRGKEIILYSQDDDASTDVAQLLIDNKFTGTIYNMVGGINAWKNAGLPTVKGL